MSCASRSLSLWMPCAVQVLQHDCLLQLLMPCVFRDLDVWEKREKEDSHQRHFKNSENGCGFGVCRECKVEK